MYSYMRKCSMLDLNRTSYPRISQECAFITQHNNHHKETYFIILWYILLGAQN